MRGAIRLQDALQACPSGWRVPSEEDWRVLERALGMSEEEIQKERGRGDPVGKRLKFGGDSGIQRPLLGMDRSPPRGQLQGHGPQRGLLDFDRRPAGRRLRDGVASGRRREPELDLAFAGERDLLALGAVRGGALSRAALAGYDLLVDRVQRDRDPLQRRPVKNPGLRIHLVPPDGGGEFLDGAERLFLARLELDEIHGDSRPARIG